MDRSNMGLRCSSSCCGSATDFLLVSTLIPGAFVPLAHRLCPVPFRYCPRVFMLTLCLFRPWRLAEKRRAMLWENRRMLRRWRPLAGVSMEMSIAWWVWLALEIWVLDVVVLHGQKNCNREELKVPFAPLDRLFYQREP